MTALRSLVALIAGTLFGLGKTGKPPVVFSINEVTAWLRTRSIGCEAGQFLDKLNEHAKRYLAHNNKFPMI